LRDRTDIKQKKKKKIFKVLDTLINAKRSVQRDNLFLIIPARLFVSEARVENLSEIRKHLNKQI